MRRAFIIHAWGASPDSNPIYHWLKSELEQHGFEVSIPKMPNSEEPKISEWVSHLDDICSEPDEETFFMGHSIGCQTVLRYLEKLPDDTNIGGVLMIAPWMHLLDTAYESEEEKEIATPWLETSINWEKIKSKTKNFTAIFSDNDYCVPMSDKDIFRELLGAEIIVEDNKGHFTKDDAVNELPSALNSLLEMTK